MLYIPSWTTRTSWNHNYKLYVEARSRTDLIITFNVDSDIVKCLEISWPETAFCSAHPADRFSQPCWTAATCSEQQTAVRAGERDQMTLLLILEREGLTPKGHLGPGQEVAKVTPPPPPHSGG